MPRRAAPLALGLLLTGAAAAAAPPPRSAAPPALEARLDLDGDGAPDVARLAADGVLTVRTAAGRPLYERRMGAAAGAPRLRALTVAGVPVVEARVPVRSARGGAEEVVVLRGAPFGEVFAGRTGPMGRDGEWSRHLSVDERSIIEYQRAASVARCDDEPTFLFPRLYDFAAGRFRPAAPAAPPRPALRVTAQRRLAGAPAGLPLARFYARSASSTLDDRGRAENLAAPTAVADGDARTAWVVGASGVGRGQFVTLRGAPGAYRVHAVRIVPGHGADRAAWLAHHRLRRVTLIFGPEQAVEVELPPEAGGADGFGGAYWAVLPAPVATSCVTARIDDVYPAAPPRGGRAPAGAGHAAIAEIQIFTELDFAGGVERLVNDLVSGHAGSDAVALVVAQGARALGPLIAALDRARGGGRARVLDALAELCPPEQASLLAYALGGRERENAAATRGLKRLGAAAGPALRHLLAAPDRPERSRAEAARLLAQSGDPATVTALVAALEVPEPEVRGAAAQALSTLDATAVIEAATAALTAAPAPDAAPAPERAAAVLRAMANSARGVPRGSPARARAADALLAVAPHVGTFEGRYRLTRAAGALGDPRLAPVLERLLGDEAPELRAAAAEAAAELPLDTATALVGRALTDVGPEVRRAALAAVQRRRELPEDPHVATLLASDRWPMVRRAAAEALGIRCRSGAALARAVGAEPVADVAEAAIRALVGCRDPQAGPALLALLENRKRPPRLREVAAAGIATLGDRAAVPWLAATLEQVRNEPNSDDQIEALAVTLARSLGRLGDERGLKALRQASVDPASARLRLAALEAIASMCPAGAHAVLAEAARSDPDARVAKAAKAAAGRCRR
jgi:HEAT repeat protein